MAKLKDLAGLAALGMLGYKMSQGDKETKGPSATAEEKEASKVRMDAQKNAVSGNRVTNESSYTGTTKNDSNAAKNIGFGGGDDSDKNLKRVDSEVKPTPAAKPVSATPVYMSKTPGGNEKRTEGNKPMPSLKAVEARAASNKTDAMRNASRKAAAASKSKTPVAPKPTTRSPNILEEAKEEARRRAAASQATSTSSSTSPVTRTPFPGSSALNKKHGGAVKMASGGMAASRRADGIAQRGKTRGKMC